LAFLPLLVGAVAAVGWLLVLLLGVGWLFLLWQSLLLLLRLLLLPLLGIYFSVARINFSTLIFIKMFYFNLF
jgi:hypothetical protein